VPIRTQQVTFALLDGAGNTLASAQVMTDANGIAQVPDNAAARGVRITDRFGNPVTMAIP
jgi:hypothetical protein